MAKMTPFFITGANAKIKVAGKTLAMCTDVSYSIRVKHASPHVLGVFESFAQEPQGYEVTGSFTIVRYTRKLKDVMFKRRNKTPDGVSASGNGIGAWGPKDAPSAIAGSAALGRPDQSLNPAFLHVPSGFTLEIIQKAGKGDEGVVARLRDCRIVQSDFKLTRRGVAVQTFSFQANYADEDTFNAGLSGVGQQFA